ncbi:glycosyltransferase [Massilia aurea]|uniref:glycosyltransferase n=1 Tax=Massilia aurea TaxID=373040 RepID=UPI003462754D
MCKVVHLTSAHPRNDIRIFIKECRTLAAQGYDVTLVVADGKGNAHTDGVAIVDAGHLPGRLNRIFKTTRRVFAQAVALDAAIYQFHDPELIPVGLKLKRLGKTVIFDAHEDTARQLVGKPYFDPLSRRVLPALFSAYERFACARFDGIIAATPSIRDLYLGINPVTVAINNFPILGEFDASVPWSMKRPQVCYVGAISGIRGIRHIVQAATLLKSGARLQLAGQFFDPAAEAHVRAHPGWQRVADLGVLDRAGVRGLLAHSVAGLVTLLPLPNHVDSLPTKMFEYMSAGIPVIASNFPLWREIIEGNGCGICVDPHDAGAIAAAIDYLVAHPDVAQTMGERGRHAVRARYNWAAEARRLTEFYGARSHAKQAIATV